MRHTDSSANRDLDSMLALIDQHWPAASVCMDRDGVSEWLSAISRPTSQAYDLRYWISHPDDQTLTIMVDTAPVTSSPRLDDVWWWEWSPGDERWVSSRQRYENDDVG